MDLDDFWRNIDFRGYDPEEPYMQDLRMVLASFTSDQQAKLLAFATGCSRPPLLGFRCAGVVG
jgi:hypothetical protein